MTVLTLSISSNGSPISPEIQVLAVQTHRALNKVPSARLSFLDGDVPNRKFPLSDSSTFAPGAEVEIKARWEGNSDASGRDISLFKGLVVRHALEARNTGCLLHVELKDKAVKDSNSISEICLAKCSVVEARDPERSEEKILPLMLISLSKNLSLESTRKCR